MFKKMLALHTFPLYLGEAHPDNKYKNGNTEEFHCVFTLDLSSNICIGLTTVNRFFSKY